MTVHVSDAAGVARARSRHMYTCAVRDIDRGRYDWQRLVELPRISTRIRSAMARHVVGRLQGRVRYLSDPRNGGPYSHVYESLRRIESALCGVRRGVLAARLVELDVVLSLGDGLRVEEAARYLEGGEWPDC